jgi:hypothetical protein
MDSLLAPQVAMRQEYFIYVHMSPCFAGVFCRKCKLSGQAILEAKMGEARRRSLNSKEILAQETRCIYCAKSSDTLEHMPPKALFRAKHRPHGYEFAACKACNDSTRVADALVSFFARVPPSDQDSEPWQLEEANRLLTPIARQSKKLVIEIFKESSAIRSWLRSRGLLQPVRAVTLEGPAVEAAMSAFGAKLGFSLYRHFVGKPMPLGGGVFTRHFFNVGPPPDAANAWLEILPGFERMEQGDWSSGNQFAYRFNTDKKSIVAAYVRLHGLVHYWIIAVADANFYAKDLRKPNLFRLIELGQLPKLSLEWLDD